MTLTQPQPLARKVPPVIVLAAVLLVAGTPAAAQDREASQPSSLVADAAKRVLLDPTTYVPSVLAYVATRRDWDTSQPFFRHGSNEMNPRFTVSGLPNDTPISYDAGNRRILLDVLVNLQVSAITNFAGHVTEHVLVERFPTHRRLIRGLGWAERISLASFLSYQLSSEHFRQARLNEQLARQWGYIP